MWKTEPICRRREKPWVLHDLFWVWPSGIRSVWPWKPPTMDPHWCLVVGLEHGFYDFPIPSIYWECHHPNWRTPSFFRGLAKKHQPVVIFGYAFRPVEEAFGQLLDKNETLLRRDKNMGKAIESWGQFSKPRPNIFTHSTTRTYGVPGTCPNTCIGPVFWYFLNSIS